MRLPTFSDYWHVPSPELGIFKVFGITIVSFRIAGGILVAVIGYHMINGNHSPSYKGME